MSARPRTAPVVASRSTGTIPAGRPESAHRPAGREGVPAALVAERGSRPRRRLHHHPRFGQGKPRLLGEHSSREPSRGPRRPPSLSIPGSQTWPVSACGFRLQSRMPRHDRGLYEVLITEALAAALRDLGEHLEARSTELRAAEAADRIALHLSRIVQRAIAAMEDDKRVASSIELARLLLAQIDASVDDANVAADTPIAPGRCSARSAPGTRRHARDDPRAAHPAARHHAADQCARASRASAPAPDRDRFGRPHRRGDGLHPPQRHRARCSTRCAAHCETRRPAARPDHDLHRLDRGGRPRRARRRSAPRCASPTTLAPPGCTPRPGSSTAAPASPPPTSARRTSPTPRRSPGWSGTCGSPARGTPTSSTSSRRSSRATGTAATSCPTTATSSSRAPTSRPSTGPHRDA